MRSKLKTVMCPEGGNSNVHIFVISCGEIAVICVSLSMVNEVAGNVPIVTDVAPVKPIPMRFIVVRQLSGQCLVKRW